MQATPRESPPPKLVLGMTGELFEFRTSSKAGDGVFRFRWTLAGGKKGPPEHVHDGERETFEVVSGTLRIWIAGQPRDLRAGERVTVAAGTRHRFLNPGKQPVVVDVSLDGHGMEDTLVPLAHHGGGRPLRLRDLPRMLVHDAHVRGSQAPSRVANAVLGGLARVLRLFGVKPLARRGGW